MSEIPRSKLEGLPVKDSRAHAKAKGASSKQLEEAADSDDQKTTLVEMLMQLEGAAGAPSGGVLRSKLEGLPVKELRARAKAKGASSEQLEEAADMVDTPYVP
jgi:hypothetical protein